jgi:uracil-DNA glycosylase
MPDPRGAALKPIDRWIDALAVAEAPRDTVNPYYDSEVGAAIRRENLRLYLTTMWDHAPRLMLVGEAPSYRGARITGVPFTSRLILLHGVPNVPLFGADRGYRLPPDSERLIHREATATMLWQTIGAIRPLPLLWNSTPFHPHRPGSPYSNRKPRAAELAIGRGFLRDLLAIFGIEQVIAVGGTAEAALRAIDVPCVRVRHPAQGGKRDFVAGLRAIIALDSPA